MFSYNALTDKYFQTVYNIKLTSCVPLFLILILFNFVDCNFLLQIALECTILQ